MKWRWLVFDYTDPNLPLSRDERRAVRREAARIVRSDRGALPKRLRPGPLATLASALAPASVMAAILVPWFLLGQPVFLIVPVLVVQILVTWLLVALVGRWSWRPAVLWTLHRRGHDVCFGCGYWLRGLDAATPCCPECATERERSD